MNTGRMLFLYQGEDETKVDLQGSFTLSFQFFFQIFYFEFELIDLIGFFKNKKI